MSKRIFKVAHSKNATTDEYLRFYVTDANDTNEIKHRPIVAEFPVSQTYDADIQEERAERFAEYMNKLAEAARQAQEQTHLIDILSRT